MPQTNDSDHSTIERADLSQENGYFGKLLHLYFVPTGRINRGAWWLNAVIVLPVLFFGAIIAGTLVAGMYYNQLSDYDYAGRDAISGLVWIVAIVCLLWCELVISTKRFHDQNRSGWWVLTNFIPFVGFFIWLIMVGFVPSHEGANRYGPDTQKRMVYIPPSVEDYNAKSR